MKVSKKTKRHKFLAKVLRIETQKRKVTRMKILAARSGMGNITYMNGCECSRIR